MSKEKEEAFDAAVDNDGDQADQDQYENDGFQQEEHNQGDSDQSKNHSKMDDHQSPSQKKGSQDDANESEEFAPAKTKKKNKDVYSDDYNYSDQEFNPYS